MRLCFLLYESVDVQITDIKATLFELALRMGLPFSLHRSENSIPPDSFVVSYGGEVPNNQKGIELPHLQNGTYDSITVNDSKLWSFSQKNIHDIVKGSINLLRFEHENINSPERDKKGRIIPTDHILYKKELLQTPLLENNANYIFCLIEQAIGRPLKRIYPWKKGSYVVAMTHDVDGPELHSKFARNRSAFLGLIKRNKFEKDSYLQSRWTRKDKSTDPYWNFDVWLEMEKQWGLKSAFYFYTLRTPNVKRHSNDPHYDFEDSKYVTEANRIKQAGWEIGLHYGINVNTDVTYRGAMNYLASKINQKKIGGRAHYWSIDVEHTPLKSFEKMDAGGLYYDASVNAQNLGFRNGSMLPISPSLFNKGVSAPLFTVLPTAIMDAYCMKRYSPKENPKKEALHLFRQIKEMNGMVILDWHVRTAHNLGAWRGFLNPLHELMQEYKSDERGISMLPSEIVDAWRKYSEKLFKGDFT